jgi:hypothetical protein
VPVDRAIIRSGGVPRWTRWRHRDDRQLVAIWNRDVDRAFSCVKLAEQLTHGVIRQSRNYDMLTMSVRVSDLVPEVPMSEEAKRHARHL